MPTYAKLTSRIPAIILSGNARTARAMETGAMNIERRCKEKSRVDTGTMRGGWQAEEVGDGEWVVFNPVEYTIFNELGTVNMPAQPMLIPAVEETTPEIIADVKRAWGT